MKLVDSSILIDYLRQYPTAVEYVDLLFKGDKAPYISVISVLELYQGARSRKSFEMVELFVGSFSVIGLSETIGEASVRIIKSYALLNGIDVPDSLIAATSLVNSFELLTRNAKHFKEIKDLHVTVPY